MQRQRSIFGGVVVLLGIAVAVIRWLGDLDFIIERTRDPGWMRDMLTLVADVSPSIVLMTTVALVGLGLFLIWLDLRRREPSLRESPLPLPIWAIGRPFPDWTIRELFFHIRPDILETECQDVWNEVRLEVHDKFATGQLEVWGRIANGKEKPLTEISMEYWRDALLFMNALTPDGEADKLVHVTNSHVKINYRDLHVSRAQAMACWPSNQSHSSSTKNDPDLVQLRRDVARLAEMLGSYQVMAAIRDEAVERYLRVENSDHQVWALNPARQLRRDFLNRCAQLMTQEAPLTGRERIDVKAELARFAERLEGVLARG